MSRPPDKEKPRPIISGIILIGLGLFLLLTSHGYLEPEQGWPLLIIAVGAGILVTAFTRRDSRRRSSEPPWQGTPPPQHQPPRPGTPPRPGHSESGQ